MSLKIYKLIIPIFLLSYSCGKKRSDHAADLSPNKKAITRDENWIQLHASLNLLQDDLERAKGAELSSEERCFKVGSIVGRAEIIGGSIKILTDRVDEKKEKARTELTYLATRLEVYRTTNKCSDISNLELENIQMHASKINSSMYEILED